MEREFLSNFQVNGQPLPEEVIEAILTESSRDAEAAKADPGVNGEGGRTFTQEDVNRIVAERLARERAKAELSPADEREQALKAREARLDCRDYLDSRKLPAALLDVLDCSDAERFRAAADALTAQFPALAQMGQVPPPYAAGTGTSTYHYGSDPIAAAFKPKL